MCASGDMDKVIFVVRVKWVGTGKIVKCGVDFLLPGILQFKRNDVNLCSKRYRLDVLTHDIRRVRKTLVAKKFYPVDFEVVMLANGYRRAPAGPAIFIGFIVQDSAQRADDYDFFGHFFIL